MLKLTVYRKVKMSRNFYVFLLIICLIAISGKMALAHGKIAIFEKAMGLFRNGDLVAAEKEFRQAQLNLSITDHNQEIEQKLATLSPIREKMEVLDEQAEEHNQEGDIDKLTAVHDSWQKYSSKWLTGTAAQKDMYLEMLALTKLDKDFYGYFTAIKKTLFANLNSVNSTKDEEAIFTNLNKIPAEYYDGEAAKTKTIETTFQDYYAAIMDGLLSRNASVSDIVGEGRRQFAMLSRWSLDDQWLRNTLDTHLVKILTKSMEKKEYANFAYQAREIKFIFSKMKEAKLFLFIEDTKTNLLKKAKTLASSHNYEEAIAMYEALKPLEDTAELITKTNLAWDYHEPIRVLAREYPDKQFPKFISADNKWGAERVVAAVSADGGLYVGRLNGVAPMNVLEADLDGSLVLQNLSFNNLGIFIEAKSEKRKSRYLAYEVQLNSLVKVLDVHADLLTMEAGRLLLDNPVGEAEGQKAYYKPDSTGIYHFSEIKTDYTEITVQDILKYQGKKVRFSATPASIISEGALVEINNETGSYLLLEGQTSLMIGKKYKVTGIFNQFLTLIIGEEPIQVPVAEVEKIED